MLVGQRRFGLIRYVMSLMNGARLGIACQSIGIAQAAYEEALTYAKHRVQFKHAIIEFPQVYEILARMKSQIQIARAITYEASRLVDVRRMIERKVDAGESALKGQLKETTTYASMLTPLAKAYASEIANQVTYDAIQIHGGTGYMREFTVERLARDARITSIYEGTTQLQVVAAMAGITSGAMGTYLAGLGERAFRPELAKLVSAAREGRERLAACVLHVKEVNDRTYTELVSRRLVDMVCDCLAAHLVLNQAEKDPDRTVVAAKVIGDAMPRIRMQAESITSGDRLLIEKRDQLL